MKWGNKYGPDYVNKLQNMVSKNLKKKFRFICFTDNNKGLKSNIDVFPLPQINMPNNKPERGWRKLSILQKDLYDVTGTCLFLDLDIVIVDNIILNFLFLSILIFLGTVKNKFKQSNMFINPNKIVSQSLFSINVDLFVELVASSIVSTNGKINITIIINKLIIKEKNNK